MNAEDFEAFIKRIKNVVASSVKIDIEPNLVNRSYIKASDNVNIYSVMKGRKYISNINTYNNLFKNSSNFWKAEDLNRSGMKLLKVFRKG